MNINLQTLIKLVANNCSNSYDNNHSNNYKNSNHGSNKDYDKHKHKHNLKKFENNHIDESNDSDNCKEK